MDMDLTRRFKRKDGVIVKDDGEGAFLFDPNTGNLKYMNRSAKETFMMFDGLKELGLIMDDLLNLYQEVEPERIREDMDRFLKELEGNEFVS